MLHIFQTQVVFISRYLGSCGLTGRFMYVSYEYNRRYSTSTLVTCLLRSLPTSRTFVDPDPWVQ